ncbi:MAG: D-alanyl-D-alanine carboxypeptidase family protein [Myxococcota bacterium]
MTGTSGGLAALTGLLFWACGDDAPAHEAHSVARDHDAVSAGSDVHATSSDAVDATATSDVGDSSATPDATPDAAGDVSADGDAAGDTTEPRSDFACDRALRLAACDDPLLDPAPRPTDAHDFLFYVNREFALPSAFPVSATSGWTPCSGGTAPGGVANDLVCLPDAYSTQPVALRQPAWESDAPASPSVTADGKPVGHNGKIGFKAAFDAAVEEGAGELFAASCFRAYSTQEAVFSGYVADEMQGGVSEEDATIAASTYSAFPGHSEHQLATTCDLVYRKPNGQVSSFGRAVAQEMYESEPFRWLYANAHRFGLVLTYAHDRVDITQYVWEPWHWRFVGVEAADVMHRCALDTEELLNARYQAGPLPPYNGDALILVDHMTIVAGDTGTLQVDPGQHVSATFTILNDGTWSFWNMLVAHVAGESLGGGDVELPCTPPLAQSDVTLELTAPSEPGLHTGSWAIVGDDGGRVVPGEIEVRLYVSGGSQSGDPYRDVRIDDLSNATGGADPGLDLDAVVLTKASGGVPTFATSVPYYDAAPGAVAHDDPSEALGAPDAFSAWPDVGTCDVGGGFVSLGGSGTIILGMARDIEAGDTLQVLEVGACDYGSGTAIADAYRVRVSVGDALTDTWEPVGQSSGGPATFTVPFLPPRQR